MWKWSDNECLVDLYAQDHWFALQTLKGNWDYRTTSLYEYTTSPLCLWSQSIRSWKNLSLSIEKEKATHLIWIRWFTWLRMFKFIPFRNSWLWIISCILLTLKTNVMLQYDAFPSALAMNRFCFMTFCSLLWTLHRKVNIYLVIIH